jgi:hypothetical protein
MKRALTPLPRIDYEKNYRWSRPMERHVQLFLLWSDMVMVPDERLLEPVRQCSHVDHILDNMTWHAWSTVHKILLITPKGCHVSTGWSLSSKTNNFECRNVSRTALLILEKNDLIVNSSRIVLERIDCELSLSPSIKNRRSRIPAVQTLPATFDPPHRSRLLPHNRYRLLQPPYEVRFIQYDAQIWWLAFEFWITGTTISLRLLASQAIWPGNFSTSGTNCVCLLAAAVPQTPFPNIIVWQATWPWNGPRINWEEFLGSMT